MKKLLTLYFFLLAGFAQSQDIFKKELFSAEKVMENREKINLTDAQATKIKKLHAESAGEFSTLKWDLDEETKKLNDMLEATKPDAAAVQTQMDKVLELESTLKKKRLATLVAIKNELDEDQVDYLKSKNQVVTGAYFFDGDAKGSNVRVINGKTTTITGMKGSGASATYFPDTENNKVMIRVNSDKSGNQPLYVINGEVMENGENGLKNIDPSEIESISVLKGTSATSLYGEEAKNGVILITLKKKK